MTHTTAPQSRPQVILGGIDLGSLDRDGLQAFVVGLDTGKPGSDALLQMAFRLDAALREAEHGLDAWEAAQADADVDTAPIPVVPPGWTPVPMTFESRDELVDWREALRDEGLTDAEIDLIKAGLPVPSLGRNWQPIGWLQARGEW